MMPHPNGAQASAPQELILPDDKIIVSRSTLREVLQLLSLTTPIVGPPRPPSRHWSAIKTLKLFRAKKLLRRALAAPN
jgi:hypothetical protein